MSKKSRHVIITGASRGFGRDIAMKLAGPETVLHLIARSDMTEVKKQLEQVGSEVRVWKKDLTQSDGLSGLMEEIAGAIETDQTDYLALVNNAGMLEPMGPAGKYDIDTYRKNLEINYVAPLLLTHAYIKLFQDLDTVKRVVMVSSGAANKPYFGWSHYCSTKAGVDMFVQVVGIEQEQQPHPVEIIAFNPGRIGTDMQKKIRETDEKDFPMVHDFVNAWNEGRIGDSSEVAGRLVQLMLSEYIPSGKILSHRDI